mgnify:CR=1 FL=1
MREKFPMVAKTFQGLEDVLRDELIALGAENVEMGVRMVTFEGDLEMLYKANFCCRTALRILKPISKFTATNPDELYDFVREFEWDQYLTPQKTFAIDSTVNSNEFTHSRFVTYRVKDGIVDYFNDKYGQRPSIRLSGADVCLNVHIFEDRVTISLDSSGESLNKRGYRVATTEAPINEVLAAGLIEWLTDWRADGIMGLAVAVFILYSGWTLARQTISPLLGEAADPGLRQQIADFISASPKVLGYHDLMVHDYGPGQRFASIHVEMDKDEDPLSCHEIIDDLERKCLEHHGVHLVIHYDPVATDDPELERMRVVVASLLRMKDDAISIHDFRMVPGTSHTNLIFDISLPVRLSGQEKAIQAALEAALNDLDEGHYHTVITFDPAELNQ